MYSVFEKPDVEVMRDAVAKIRSLKTEKVQVLSVIYNAGSEVGENFASTMKKASVKGQIEGQGDFEENLMCKFAPRDSNAGTWFEHMKLFERESEFYSEYLPTVKEILLKNDFEVPFIVCGHAGGLKSGIIMENAKLAGYEIDEAAKMLELSRLESIVDALAPYHAVGHKIWTDLGEQEFFRRFPVIARCAEDGMFSTTHQETVEYMSGIFGGIIQKSIAAIENLLEPSFHQRMKEFVSSGSVFRLAGEKRKSRKPGDFLSVAHGDVWCNNVMFQRETNRVKFVDAQNVALTRPVIDLVILFYQSASPKTRKDHLENLLQRYHSQLMKALIKLGFKDDHYQYEKFRRDFDDFFVSGFMMGFVNILTVLNTDDIIDMVKKEAKVDESEEEAEKTLKKMKIAQERLIAIAEEAKDKKLF